MKPAVPVDLVRAWLAYNLGPVSGLHRLVEGEESQAFGVRCADGERVVRINGDRAGFAKDAFAHRFDGPALPVPRVVTIGELSTGHAVCVSTRLPGRSLQDLERAELSGVAPLVEATMSAIADLSGTRGFGRFDADGVGEHRSWRDFLASTPPPDSDLGRRLHAELLRLVPSCPEVRQLVHGDFGSNNVLTDGTRITGVLDWDCAMFGDPLYDVANILFWATWLDCMDVQAAHLRPEATDALRCYLIHIALGELREHSPDERFTAWLHPRAARLLTSEWAT
ncbi:phosphotransferase family protein [Saccharopolyspora taberi]|uniref:phosphotransferase family protein n=1 Tax=Saccharopolyspora taberi TaxID=60895 RepID=UPI0031E48478